VFFTADCLAVSSMATTGYGTDGVRYGPKKASTSYFMFTASVRAQVKLDNPDVRAVLCVHLQLRLAHALRPSFASSALCVHLQLRHLRLRCHLRLGLRLGLRSRARHRPGQPPSLCRSVLLSLRLRLQPLSPGLSAASVEQREAEG
jgi:hypothetical protein